MGKSHRNMLTAQRSYGSITPVAVQFPRKDACSYEQTALPSEHHCQPWPVCNEHQPRTYPPPTNVLPLSSALMQGMHEECLRLMTRAMQGRTTAQDYNDASLWYAMVGEHLKETHFDDFIRPAASKILSQIEMTGAPLDGSAIESHISKELSARVGWDVTGEVHNILESYIPEETKALRQIQQQGISQSFLDLSAGFAQIAVTKPARLVVKRKRPGVQEAAFSGGQSSPAYPPPPPRPPIITFCKILGNVGEGSIAGSIVGWITEACTVGVVLSGGVTCISLIGLALAGTVAAYYAESYC